MSADADPSIHGDDEQPLRESVLISGFPAFAARRMAGKILAEDADARLWLLVREDAVADAQAFAGGLEPAAARRVRVVIGDAQAMDLGLSGPEYRVLARELTTIHHMAGLHPAGGPASGRALVEGTRHVIELAAETRELRRLCHWSTILVSGKRRGLILEDELDQGQAFHDAYEQSMLAAERLARHAQRRMPVTIFRPGLIVGDSRTGEIDAFRGPSSLIALIATSAPHVRLPLPGSGDAPLHIVPIDFVIDAAYALSRDERAAGRTLHLTDPHPLPAQRVYELVAEHAGTRPPHTFWPGGLARALLRVPGVAALARGLELIGSVDHPVSYDSRAAQELLADTGIRCPRLDSYVANLVRYIRDVDRARRHASQDDELDPLD